MAWSAPAMRYTQPATRIKAFVRLRRPLAAGDVCRSVRLNSVAAGENCRNAQRAGTLEMSLSLCYKVLHAHADSPGLGRAAGAHHSLSFVPGRGAGGCRPPTAI